MTRKSLADQPVRSRDRHDSLLCAINGPEQMVGFRSEWCARLVILTLSMSHDRAGRMPLRAAVVPTTSTMSAHFSLSPLFSEGQTVDRKRSRSVAQQLKARPKYAWRNSVAALLELILTGIYVEGLVADSTQKPHMIREHAWVQTPDGIIDPTPRFLSAASEVAYFAAHTWTAEELREMHESSDDGIMLPLAWSLPVSGKELPSFRKALVAAHRHMSAVHLRDTCEPFYPPEREDHLLRVMFDKALVSGFQTQR